MLEEAVQQHPSEKWNREAAERQQEALLRLREAAGACMASNPTAWNKMFVEMQGLLDITEELFRRNPYEYLGNRVAPEYYALCHAHTQGQREILETLFAQLGVKPSGLPANPKGARSPTNRLHRVARKLLGGVQFFLAKLKGLW